MCNYNFFSTEIQCQLGHIAPKGDPNDLRYFHCLKCQKYKMSERSFFCSACGNVNVCFDCAFPMDTNTGIYFNLLYYDIFLRKYEVFIEIDIRSYQH